MDGKTSAWTCFDPAGDQGWSLRFTPSGLSISASSGFEDWRLAEPKISAFTPHGVVQALESEDVRLLVGTDHCGEFVAMGVKSVEPFGPSVLVEPEEGLVPWLFLERYIPNIRQMIANKMALEGLDEAEEED